MDNIIKENITNINISNEIKQSFLDYSMSVIVSRAIPDVRDGLKPVHRRILYAMYSDGTTPDKAYKKSAQSVGTVMGKFHPHGNTAIYDSMVRMAQDFSYRHKLIDGQGAFGAPDGSAAAAERYTEARLDKISMELLRDINKDSVDFVPNYDDSIKEPSILPSRFPNILVNGNMGIAVGMATNIPPHNLIESINATIAYMENPDIEVSELMEHIKGPDFPTGGYILGNSGAKKAFETGRGTVVMRAKIDTEEKAGRHKLIITEIPYQVNYTNIIKKIAELVRDKEIEGIANLTDESALEGIRIVIDVKNGYNPSVLLNNLFKHTQLQTSFGINFLMLVDGRPKTLGLKDILYHYLNHQREVVLRRTKFDLEKATARAHLLDGFVIALDNIDVIIEMIRASMDDKKLIEDMSLKFNLSEEQALAILEMRLKRLSGLEKQKIEDELALLREQIEYLKGIINSEEKLLSVIKEEMLEIRDLYGNERRTEIDMTAIEFIDDESLIPVEDIIITITNKGYIKRMNSDVYKIQNRGGVGIRGMATNDDDDVDEMINMTTHDYVLMFSNLGKVYRLKGYEIPLFSRISKGLPIVNLIQLAEGEEITALLSVKDNETQSNIVFCTQKGLIKRTGLNEFDNIRLSGKIAITLREGDSLISVKKTCGKDKIMIGTSKGSMIHFEESEVRVMGRNAIGVIGINLNIDDVVVGMEVVSEDDKILVVTEKGYGKITPVSEYRLTRRGGKGVKALNITDRNGNIISVKKVFDDDELIIISDEGIIIRMFVNQISITGRVTQGVRLMHLKDNQKVVAVTLVSVDLENTEEGICKEETN